MQAQQRNFKGTTAVPVKDENVSKSDKGFNVSAYGKEFSAGSVMGLAVGVATKRLTSDALYGAGIAVIGLQTLSYLGYIQINWHAINEDVTKAVDQNNDGKLDATDVKLILQRFLKYASHGMADATGFTAGFFAGWKFF